MITPGKDQIRGAKRVPVFGPGHTDCTVGLQDLAQLAVDDAGVIRQCSATCEAVFGYVQDELAGRHVSLLLPELADTQLVLEDRLNPRLAYFCHCAVPFRAQRRDGTHFAGEVFINRLGEQNVAVLVRRLEA